MRPLDLAPARGKPPTHLADLDPGRRREAVVGLGLPAFRADQLSRQYFGRYVDDPVEMSDLPASVRAAVAQALFPRLLTAQGEQVADGGDTVKTLWRLADGARVESVLMRYRHRNSAHAELGAESDDAAAVSPTAAPGAATATATARLTVCISSQAGCGMACPFCATGQLGLTRNLSTAEIVDQVVAACRVGRERGLADRVSNVVFMGMGEPLANYPAVLGALHRLTDPAPHGLGLSPRRLTVSTVGLVPRMTSLIEQGRGVTLALSLHAPDDELRDELVPVNSRWPVAEVLDAAKAYAAGTGRRVSIEYALIRDVNDQAWRAQRLAQLLGARGRGWVHVNPIPLNPTPGSRWTASRPADERTFVRVLREAGISTTVRDTRGRDIDGACGQLAAATTD